MTDAQVFNIFLVIALKADDFLWFLGNVLYFWFARGLKPRSLVLVLVVLFISPSVFGTVFLQGKVPLN